jgi:putative oxidoreductase
MRRILTHLPYQQSTVLSVVRVLIGIFMAYHGSEIFDAQKMNEYKKWMTDLDYMPSWGPYVGKASELIGGLLLAFGLFTRIAALLLVLTMSAITFGVGDGRIFMEEQYPFLFVVFGFIFLFLGGGDFSMDKKLFSTN